MIEKKEKKDIKKVKDKYRKILYLYLQLQLLL